MSRLEITPLEGLPELSAGGPLGSMIGDAGAELGLGDGDVLVVSQKAVSKVEGRVRDLRSVESGERARRLGAELGKDPRLVELVLSESTRLVRAEGEVLITETRSGWICANAGIDASNVPGSDTVALLPEDPDGSARRLRSEIAAAVGGRPAVVIADSFGRPWRIGQVDVAIGCAGLTAIDDWRGREDAGGRELTSTAIAVADELAAAADLARSKTSRTPAVLVRGAERWWSEADGAGAAPLRRAEADDLFR